MMGEEYPESWIGRVQGCNRIILQGQMYYALKSFRKLSPAQIGDFVEDLQRGGEVLTHFQQVRSRTLLYRRYVVIF